MDRSATGGGDRGPDPEDCVARATVQSLLLDAGFEIRSASERRETVTVVPCRRE